MGLFPEGAGPSAPDDGREPDPSGDAAWAAARAWLERRSPAPEALRGRMEDALDLARGAPQPQPPPDGIPAALAAAAIVLLEEGRRRSGRGRKHARAGATGELEEVNRAARDLLAADALLTHACEVAAEVGPEAVLALERSFGPGRLSRLLPDPESA